MDLEKSEEERKLGNEVSLRELNLYLVRVTSPGGGPALDCTSHVRNRMAACLG